MVALAVAALALAVAALSLVVALASRRRAPRVENPHAALLGRQCVVTDGGRSYLATCVAVGWHGSVAVRGMTLDTRRTLWVPKGAVADRVRWCDDG